MQGLSAAHSIETRCDASLIIMIEENSCAVFGQVQCVYLFFSCFGVVCVCFFSSFLLIFFVLTNLDPQSELKRSLTLVSKALRRHRAPLSLRVLQRVLTCR